MNKGIAGSAGYGVGKVVIISDAKPEYENRTITDTDAEIKRYDDAVAAFTEKTHAMAEALKVVHVAGEISNALIYRIGVLAPVYDFMLQYETANWAEVSRLMLLKNIDMNRVFEAYTSALKWYRTVR